MTTDSTTIQISISNRDRLDELGELMQRLHPNLLTARPAYNVIVGYAVDHALDSLGVEEGR
jgi:hypothetical protein